MKRTAKVSGIITMIAAFALLSMLSGCGGGGGGSTASAPAAQATGKGKVAARVMLTPPAARVASGATAFSTVTVAIDISGVYSLTNEEFTPVSATNVIDIASGTARVSMMEVPIGVNHLLSVTADWGVATDSLKAIIPEVAEGETASVIVNPESTIVAETALYIAAQNSERLADMDAADISAIEAAVASLYSNGTPYESMTPQTVVSYMAGMSIPASLNITPASATVLVGQTTQFTGALFDSNGTEMTGATYTWSFAPSGTGTVGTVDANGLFTASSDGDGILTLNSGGLTATAPISVISSCSDNSQCDDGDAYTFDTCINPGTSSSSCTHEAIACLSDTDCNDNNTSTTDTCSTPGTTTAVCNNTPIIANNPPTASATADITSGQAPLSVNFSSSCTDTDGTCVSYSWDFGDGSPTVSAQSASHTFTASGTYSVVITVTDDQGGIATGSVSVTVTGNIAPTATSSGSPTTGIAPLTVSFTGGCTDSDGSCMLYSWDFGDGATSTNQNATYTYSVSGTYNAVLTVTDNQGAIATSAVTITVAANSAPTASASSDVTSGVETVTVNFTGSCTDSDGSCVAYSWDFGDGSPIVSTQNASHTYTATGTFNAVLTVTDDLGASATDAISITVSPNVAPTASASPDVSTGIAPLTVNFTGGCTDGDGSCVAYSWDFGDGATSTTQNPSHVYSATGTFTATLTVTDNLGATGVSTTSVTVAQNQPPVSSITPDVASGTIPFTVNFTGSCTDPDGSCIAYNLDFGDGSPTVSTLNASHTYTASGTFIVTLTAYDNLGAYVLATTTITSLAIPPSSFSIGNTHSCVVVSGEAKCTGLNDYGAIGDGTISQRYFYTDVSGLTNNTLNISAGVTGSSCAVTTSNGLKCWGLNGSGQLGNATTTNSVVPVDVSGLTSGVQMASVAHSSACALTTTGGVKCWGDNTYGQLGDSTNTSSSTPLDVGFLTSGVSAVSSRAWFACAAMAGGSVYCWGEGGAGQLGNGSNSNSNSPVTVNGMVTATKASAGYNSACALQSNGSIMCWGGNGSGQLGNGTTTDTNMPGYVPEFMSGGAVDVQVGWRHACALTTSGGMKCWGENTAGQLGDGTVANSTTPVDVTGLTSGVTAMFVGQASTCAVHNGIFKCWGQNASGELGDGTTTNRLTPVIIDP